MNLHISIPSNQHMKLLMLLFLMLVGTHSLLSAIRLPALVSDRMVLQRDTELVLWGWADVGEKVTVRFQGGLYDTEGGPDGKWSVTLPPQMPGGPFVMEINEITIRDILIGDVWLCSGQSNQETPITRLVDRFPEINVSNNHMIRHFKVPGQETVEFPLESMAEGGRWHSATASEVLHWTALAYFFAQEAYLTYNVPVGMLVSSKGGSAIESWISQEQLKDFPEFVVDREALEMLKQAETDKGIAGKWASSGLDDADWESMEVPGRWQENGLHTKGVVWYRKDFDMPDSMDGKHARLHLGMLIDSDSVFVNGRFVGSTSYMYPPRKYDIPAGVLKQGNNNITVKLTAHSGNGGFVDDKPYKIVGDNVEIDLTGSWKYKVGKDLNGVEQYVARIKNLDAAGSGLYNGMIYPIRDYKVKGVIWYQGESNAGRPQTYTSLLKSLIADWRGLWNNPALPFLMVQLPNFMEKSDQPSESGWAAIREAQLNVAMAVPNTVLAVTYDTGEWNDIHPLNKKDVAHRLFLGAREKVYGEEIVSAGPLYKDMEIEGNSIIMTFTETGSGLTSRDEAPLKHFAIAGNDRKFVWAEATIEGNKVRVSSEDVPLPMAVRYAWANNPEEANLINKEGLLASPFRTDNW